MGRYQRALVAALALSSSVAFAGGKKPPKPPVTPPPPVLTPEQQKAQDLFNQGRDLLAAQSYEQACQAFQDSQDIDPAVGTELNLGRCYEEWGKLLKAAEAYSEAERLATERKDERASAAHTFGEKVRVRTPKLTFQFSAGIGDDATFKVDSLVRTRAELGVPLLLDPGTHTVEVAQGSAEPVTTTVVVVEGDEKQVVLVAPAPPQAVITYENRRSAPKFYGGITLGVVGVGALAAASILSLGAKSDYRDATVNCMDGVCPDQDDANAANDARTTAKNMTFVAAGGLVLVGVGVVLVLTSHERIEHRSVAVAPVLGRDVVGFAIGGSL